MITISGVQIPVYTVSWPPVAKQVYERKMNSSVTYNYRSVHHLRFEMYMRSAIVAAAVALSQSGIRFSSYKNARCNQQLWNLTELGGFQIKDGVTPAAGIRDIFANGNRYATECATASVIALYKGTLDSIRLADFNRLFAGLLLYDWHMDADLRLTRELGIGSAYPGDLLYFDNPDFSPETPYWRGENVVKIGDDLYYGHPFGVASAERMIVGLNRFRRPDSTKSAYLTDTVVHPDFLYLSQFAAGAERLDEASIRRFMGEQSAVYAVIGSRRFVN